MSSLCRLYATDEIADPKKTKKAERKIQNVLIFIPETIELVIPCGYGATPIDYGYTREGLNGNLVP